MSTHEWKRTDWFGPVGVTYTAPEYIPVTDTWSGYVLNWTLIKIPALELSHRAALWLLQGVKLSSILIPNMDLDGDYFHLVLGSLFTPWRGPPTVRDLKLAKLSDIPSGIPDQNILELLVKQALDR